LKKVTEPAPPYATPSRRVGSLQIGAVALGTASWALQNPPLRTRTAAWVLRAAVESGVSLVDTALAYSTSNEQSYSERLLAEALRSLGGRERPVIATKGGHFRRGDSFVIDGRPETIRSNCEHSLRALGLETIELHFLHKPDPAIPLVESVGAIAELQQAGKVRFIGLSNVSTAQLTEARSVTDIAAVQNRLGASTRNPVIGRCEASGIAYLGYSPFEGSPHAAKRNPRAAEIAAAHMASPHQVVIARHFLSSSAITVIVGARRPATIRDSAAAATLRLTPGEIALIEAAEPPAHSPHPAVSAV